MLEHVGHVDGLLGRCGLERVVARRGLDRGDQLKRVVTAGLIRDRLDELILVAETLERAFFREGNALR